jgi:hypothetical protein
MAKIPEQLKQIFQELQLEPQDAVWDCHGTPVVLHKALELVAAHKGITFDSPVMIEADAQTKSVVMLVTGHLGDQVEWSIGEATPYNNKNSYPFAMAEKRAKDRVILKLINIAGYVYSEEEADDFKASRPQRAAAPEPAPEPAAAEPERGPWETWANSAMNKIKKLASEEGGASKLTGWFSGNMKDLKGLKAADQQLFELLRAYYDEQYEKANTGERK